MQRRPVAAWFPHGRKLNTKLVSAPAKPADVRAFPRAATRAAARCAWRDGRHIAAICLDIGGGGLCLMTEKPYSLAELSNCEIRTFVRGRTLAFHAKARWHSSVRAATDVIHRYGMVFTKIDDGAWNWIMEGIGASGRHPAAGALLTSAQLEHLLTRERQTEIVRGLISRERLDDIEGSPLVEYHFGGYTMREGCAYRRLVVRSKRSSKWGDQGFMSKILVPLDGQHPCTFE